MSAAEVWDELAAMFGIGDFDEYAKPDPPYFKIRMTGIGQLSRMMKSRRVSEQQVRLAASYCQRHHKPVRVIGDVFRCITDAQRENYERIKSERREAVRSRISNAVADALEAGDTALATRLQRMEPDQAIELLEEARG